MELTIEGENVHEAVELIASFPVKVTFQQPTTDPFKVKAKLEVPEDAPLGWHTVRLHTKRGTSNLKLFCIDELPQVLVTGMPYEPSKAMEVPVPSVVCGTMPSQQRQYLAVKLDAGQPLCAEILGRRLGSPLDPALVLYDAATGRQVEFSDDAPGLQKDARFRFVAPKAGTYHLEVRDVRYSGGSDWHYRLRLGNFPLASTAFPLAVERGKKTTLQFAGPFVDAVASVEVTAPKNTTLQAIVVAPRFMKPNTQAGWPVSVILSDFTELIRNPADGESLLPFSTGISARFLKQGEKHTYRLKLPKGIACRVEANGQELGSPATVYLTLADVKGMRVASSNPEAEFARIDFTAPEAADYLLTAEHLYFAGGPDQSYRLTALPINPSFTLSANVDHVDLSPNSRAVIVVQADRSGGYNGALQLNVVNPTAIKGSAMIPAGKSSAFMEMKSSATLSTSAPLLIEAKGSGTTEPAYLRITSSLRPQFNDLLYPPMTLDTFPRIASMPAIPFRFSAEFVHAHGVRGLALPVQFHVERQGYQGEVTITSMIVPGLPNQKPVIAPLSAKVPAGQERVIGNLTAEANAPENEPVVFIAKASVDGRELTTTTSLMPVKFGAALTVATRETSITALPWKLNVKPALSPYFVLDALSGTRMHTSTLDLSWLAPTLPKSSIEVLITRQGGFNGPVQLAVINAPMGTTAGSALVPSGITQVRIPIVAQSNSKPITRNDVMIEATAIGVANQKATSQPISVTVK